MSCSFCSDPEFVGFDVLEDDETGCRTPGCGVVFSEDDIDPDDVAYGFSIVYGDAPLDAPDASEITLDEPQVRMYGEAEIIEAAGALDGEL